MSAGVCGQRKPRSACEIWANQGLSYWLREQRPWWHCVRKGVLEMSGLSCPFQYGSSVFVSFMSGHVLFEYCVYLSHIHYFYFRCPGKAEVCGCGLSGVFPFNYCFNNAFLMALVIWLSVICSEKDAVLANTQYVSQKRRFDVAVMHKHKRHDDFETTLVRYILCVCWDRHGWDGSAFAVRIRNVLMWRINWAYHGLHIWHWPTYYHDENTAIQIYRKFSLKKFKIFR